MALSGFFKFGRFLHGNNDNVNSADEDIKDLVENVLNDVSPSQNQNNFNTNTATQSSDNTISSNTTTAYITHTPGLPPIVSNQPIANQLNGINNQPQSSSNYKIPKLFSPNPFYPNQSIPVIINNSNKNQISPMIQISPMQHTHQQHQQHQQQQLQQNINTYTPTYVHHHHQQSSSSSNGHYHQSSSSNDINLLITKLNLNIMPPIQSAAKPDLNAADNHDRKVWGTSDIDDYEPFSPTDIEEILSSEEDDEDDGDDNNVNVNKNLALDKTQFLGDNKSDRQLMRLRSVNKWNKDAIQKHEQELIDAVNTLSYNNYASGGLTGLY